MIPILFVYLLKVTVSLGMVYLFYRLILQNLTFYNWNRYYLLGFTALSFFIPLINVSALWEGSSETTLPAMIQYIPPVEAVASTSFTFPVVESSTFNVWDWLLLILLSGSGILLMKTIVQFFSFIRIKKAACLISDQGIKIYQVDANMLPFSFGRSIFINQALHQEKDLPEIIRHELVHVQQNHTVDIIWIELVCILNWYNPFAWLLRQQLRQNLEFIADNQVLLSGIDKKHYQYLLLQVTGRTPFRLANQFNFSTLKKRIVMMNKMPSNRPELAKFLFLLPVVGILLFSFRSGHRPDGRADNLGLPLVNENGVNIYDQGSPNKQIEPKTLVNWEPDGKNNMVAMFLDGSRETYDLTTEEGKQKMRKAQLFVGDAYTPENTERQWSEEFKTFMNRNPQIAKLKWRYDREQIEKQLRDKGFFYPADRLYLTLNSGAEEVYMIENQEDLTKAESKLGKLPMLPPPSPTLKLE